MEPKDIETSIAAIEDRIAGFQNRCVRLQRRIVSVYDAIGISRLCHLHEEICPSGDPQEEIMEVTEEGQGDGRGGAVTNSQ